MRMKNGKENYYHERVITTNPDEFIFSFSFPLSLSSFLLIFAFLFFSLIFFFSFLSVLLFSFSFYFFFLINTIPPRERRSRSFRFGDYFKEKATRRRWMAQRELQRRYFHRHQHNYISRKEGHARTKIKP